jgi:formylglycine-generating enzyme required for sulfatase activity
VSGFRLDKYLVTVGRFRQFVNAWNGIGAPPTPPQAVHLLATPASGAGKHSHLNGGSGLQDVSAPGVAYEPGWQPSETANLAPTDANLLSCKDVTIDSSGSTQTVVLSTWTSTPGTQEDMPISCVTWAEAYAFCIWDGGFLPSEAEWEAAASGGVDFEYPWGNVNPGTQNQYAIYNAYYGPQCGPLQTCIPDLLNIAPVGRRPRGWPAGVSSIWRAR